MKKLNKEEMRQLFMLRQELGTLKFRIEKVRNFLNKKGWEGTDSMIGDVDEEVKNLADKVRILIRANESL